MDYIEMARMMADRYGVDPDVFVRQIMQESRFDPEAVSPKGAVGIAQIMPDTARAPGYSVVPIADRSDPEESLRFAAEYMRALLNKYNGDYALALAAYNAGPGKVDKYNGVPPIKETQDYVAKILGAPAGEEFSLGMPAGSQGSAMYPTGITPYSDLEESQMARDPAAQRSLLESFLSGQRSSADQQGLMSFVSAARQRPRAMDSQPMAESLRFAIPEARGVETVLERRRN